MSEKKGITIPKWILYFVVIAVIIVGVYLVVPGGNEGLTGLGTTVAGTVIGWSNTIGESPLWRGYWWVFTGAGVTVVFMIGRWTMKKEQNLYGWFAQKAWNRARETDPTIDYGYGRGSGPTGPGGAGAVDQRKKDENTLP